MRRRQFVAGLLTAPGLARTYIDPSIASPLQPSTASSTSPFGWNSDNIRGFSADMPFMQIVRSVQLTMKDASDTISKKDDDDDFPPRDPATWLPVEIQPGYDRFRFTWSWGSRESTHSFFAGPYVLRHNLPSGYTIQISNVENLVVASPTRITFDVAVGKNWWVNVIRDAGDGPMPDGWFIEVFLAEHEALVDDDTKDPLDARRHFRPIFLQKLQEIGCAEWRTMRWNDVWGDIDKVRTTADIAPWGAYTFGKVVPVEHSVAFCNYLNCDLFWNEFLQGDDALKKRNATYIRDNLKASLNVIVELGNELWNSSNPSWRRASAVGLARPVGNGAQGPGTVTGVKGETIITGTGVDFSEVFVGNEQPFLAADGIMYQIDPATIQPTQFTLRYSGKVESNFKDEVWYYNTAKSQSERSRGQLIMASNCAQIYQNIFNAAGQRGRLINALGGQLANGSGTDRLRRPKDHKQDPIYIDPATIFDTVVLNPYLGSGLKRNAEIMAELEGYWTANDTQAWRTLYKQILTDTHPTYSERGNTADQITRFQRHKTSADQDGLTLRIYECGYHVIHGLSAEQAKWMVPQFQDFMNSPASDEVLYAWLASIKDYISGPVTTYKFISRHGRYGVWGIYEDYGYTDGRVRWYEKVRDTEEPWWTTD